MWAKIKASLNSSILINGIFYGGAALVFLSFKLAWAAIAAVVVFVGLWVANILVSNASYTVAHMCSPEDMESIRRNGFNAGKAEANLTEEQKKLSTQNGNADNVCFTLTDLEPVRKMRKHLGDKELQVIYFKFDNINNVRLSEMVTTWLGFSRQHGTIVEAGIHRDIVNERIRNGEYTIDESDDFGKGFNVFCLKAVKYLWSDVRVEQLFGNQNAFGYAI